MTVRRIGLSLGADLCWPIFYEDILSELSPTVRLGGESITFEINPGPGEDIDAVLV